MIESLMNSVSQSGTNWEELATDIRRWGLELGFQAVGIAPLEPGEAGEEFLQWLQAGHHGEMGFMERHRNLRIHPQALLPGALRVISVRLDYLPQSQQAAWRILDDPHRAYVARYALGRDYHKLIRRRLQRLARRIEERLGRPFVHRAFCDSAPVLEKPLAHRAGLGWQGKHTNLLSRSGSWFFLGELYVGLPLPVDEPVADHCGRCRACIDVCPTQAIIAPYRLDARRCIAYLTIEHPGPIPEALRPAMGNRVFGCDDCQLVCPWNRFARLTTEADFLPRHRLEQAGLLELFTWDEETFLRRTEGSAIRRLGHTRWLRNLAVALGNAPPSLAIRQALARRLDHPAELVREHVRWALMRQTRRGSEP